MLTGFYSRKGFEAPLRRIKFNDPETGKRLVFLTNAAGDERGLASNWMGRSMICDSWRICGRALPWRSRGSEHDEQLCTRLAPVPHSPVCSI
jgi:hypothetical protein